MSLDALIAKWRARTGIGDCAGPVNNDARRAFVQCADELEAELGSQVSPDCEALAVELDAWAFIREAEADPKNYEGDDYIGPLDLKTEKRERTAWLRRAAAALRSKRQPLTDEAIATEAVTRIGEGEPPQFFAEPICRAWFEAGAKWARDFRPAWSEADVLRIAIAWTNTEGADYLFAGTSSESRRPSPIRWGHLTEKKQERIKHNMRAVLAALDTPEKGLSPE